MSSGHRLKAIIAACVGLLLATVGRDGFTSAERFTFDSLSLADGLDFVPIDIVIVFGALGYLMKKLGFDPGPLVPAFVLEDSLRRSLLIFDGDATGLFTRPISGTLLAAFVLVAALPGIRALVRRRATEQERSGSAQ